MGTIKSFKDLDAWRVGMDLVLMAYERAKLLPATERFELAAQMRRAAVSVPSNVGGRANRSAQPDDTCFTFAWRSDRSASLLRTSSLPSGCTISHRRQFTRWRHNLNAQVSCFTGSHAASD